MKRRLYRLSPAAEDGDPNWDLAENHGVVVVRADSPADARIVAAEAEDDYLDVDAKPAGGVTTRNASAFRSHRLYAVTEIAPGEFPADGPREVLEGRIRNPLKPGTTGKPPPGGLR